MLSAYLARQIYGIEQPLAPSRELMAALAECSWHWLFCQRVLDGIHVDGRRQLPYGPDNCRRQ